MVHVSIACYARERPLRRACVFLKIHRIRCLERKDTYKSDPAAFNKQFGVI
jgi:hypothetical protein